jgi:hypothetical protein
MQHDVYVFATMRAKVEGIEAKNYKEASQKATKVVDWDTLFLLRENVMVPGSKFPVKSIAFDEFSGFLVHDGGIDNGEFLYRDGDTYVNDTCHDCKQTSKPSISLDLLRAILERENSVIDEGDVQALMTTIRREANSERRGKKTALSDEESS